jgi:glycosyltransferase involved in cell wall biosynthesis
MGRLVRPRDPEALAEGIVQVLSDPDRYRRTPQQVRQVFSTERTVAQYLEVFERLCERGPKGGDAGE